MIINNDYQNNSRVLYTFVSNKSFTQLLDISPKHFIFLKLLIQSFLTMKYGLLLLAIEFNQEIKGCKKLRIFVFCLKYGQKHW